MKIVFPIGSTVIAFLVVGLPLLALAAPPANDDCSGAIALTSTTVTCTFSGNATYTLGSSTPSTVSTCNSGTHYDVWFSFVAASSKETVTIANYGTSINNPEIQLLSGNCTALTSVACGALNNTTLTVTTLTAGTKYYVRVSNVGAAPSGTGQAAPKFDICVTHPAPPPANDECSGAVTLTSNTSCSNTSAVLDGATASTVSATTCTSGTHNDVWFSFVAASVKETVTISLPNGTSITNPEVQLLNGTCGTLSSLACGTTSIVSTNLTKGTTYYVRVSNLGSSINSGGSFSICITHPASAKIDYSRSYINVTKGAAGGTVDPGDTLEMRATFVVSSLSVDSLALFDTLYSSKGLKFVPGSLALRTNEGVIYKSFTDVADNDAGGITPSGQDTLIRINFGNGANNFARGQLSNTSKPSVFGSTCIIMATYRVVVYAGYNTKINFKTGALTYRDPVIGVVNNVAFAPNNLIVYQSPGLCPNAVSPTNTLGAEYNGTFGVPSGGAPLARNRGTSPNTGYTYAPFTQTSGPNDYYYGIANNTSQNFATITTYAKPDVSPSHRVFGVWDITGDHTGAANAVKGNSPCDTTKPVSPTNPCGYMLVINSAYRTDTAFTHTITNLCPNTYYELSAWFKNICYKCGCDSNGVGAGSAGYLVTNPGDSSGVRPNIAFDVNGTDYYTTGDLKYLGTTQAGSDSTNKWVKRGFTYLTGPTETSFRLTLRNNAPGGGGNDWALDDISVATCSPNLTFTPSANPSACSENVIEISGTIKSYFNNYNYYKWEKSTDNGVNWVATSYSGTGSPSRDGSGNYQYTVNYPKFVANKVDSGSQYRLLVATTGSNLSSTCALSGDTKLVLNVLDCHGVLGVNFISFTGKMDKGTSFLMWTTSKENEDILFVIEKSEDGYHFNAAGFVYGSKSNNHFNTYNWLEANMTNQKVYYRIKMISNGSGEKYTKIILLDPASVPQDVIQVANPFTNKIAIELRTNTSGIVHVELVNNNGVVVRKQSVPATEGINLFTVSNTENLPSGYYVLKIATANTVITKKLLKQ